MNDSFKIAVFVSSAHYGLEDLRGELVDYLEKLGTLPLVSSERGFPDQAGVPPYVQCLRVLEKALIVLGVVDRRYGRRLDEWEPYGQYNGLSPTHAELRHALASKKRLMVYHRSDIEGFYEIYRKNKNSFEKLNLPNGLEVDALEMYAELKKAKPAPWIESFRDVRDIKESVRKRLLFDLHEALAKKERLSQLGVEILLERILETDPELLRRVLSALDDVPENRKRELMQYIEKLLEPGEGVAAPSPQRFRALEALSYRMALAA
jgi:hypothetical protein